MNLPDSSILTNIQVPGHTRPLDILFEKKYITTRSLENRLYTDEEVMHLPAISPSHTHAGEWQLRKRSACRLLRYLAGGSKSPAILDIGCGNGWLSHLLAGIPGSRVTGLDINFTELQQAARVFNDDPNLSFIHGDLRAGLLQGMTFDYIIFAASIEYFPSLKKAVHLALSFLKPEGEVHILDSHLYRPADVELAKKLTHGYYLQMGYPEMADFYFHHSSRDLQSFHHILLYNPRSIGNRLFGSVRGLPWVRIMN